jgi:glycosyltransferase involved in cell wall biosynthesis
MKKLKIFINDFGGYPFPVELSRYISMVGYSVIHCYLSNINTPHGNMAKSEGDSEQLQIIPIKLDSEFKKYSFLGRITGELEYAKKVSKIIDEYNPDIFLSANTPLIAQTIIQKKCLKGNIRFIYWCQDIHSIALKGFFKKRIPLFGSLIANYFEAKEIELLKSSDSIITISKSFNQVFEKWKISQKNIETIHNWAPLNEIDLYPKNNDWTIQQGLDSKFVILYSGTLGLKHNPLLILEAAKELQSDPRYLFLVVSEGLGAELLKKEKIANKLTNLKIMPFQDYEILPKILASADVLLSILENDAATYSVPSKVLTYLCSNRPIILSVSSDNLAVKIIEESNAGYFIEPGNTNQLVDRIKILSDNPELQAILGRNGRIYAEANFNITKIGEKFITIFNN